MTIAGATPYAETPDAVAAVEGRIARTMDGIRPNRGVRFGASTTVARALLAAREHDPAVRFAANCRLADAIEDALSSLNGRRCVRPRRAPGRGFRRRYRVGRRPGLRDQRGDTGRRRRPRGRGY